MTKRLFFPTIAMVLCCLSTQAQSFKLNESGYFNNGGVDVMSFSDFYPEGHQGGVTIIMNGKRLCANGDIRFEPTPGQWQPVPAQLNRKVEADKIVTNLMFPDTTRHNTGFNPMFYPDVRLKYKVTLEPQGAGLLVTVDLESPIPDALVGRAGFNLELFPGELFGKPWIMDNHTGVFPQQPNSPVIEQKSYLDISVGDFKPKRSQAANLEHLNATGYSPYRADEVIAEPYATGRSFVMNPNDKLSKITIKTLTSDLQLYDGRMNHNNGWFVLHSDIPAGATNGAVKWYIEPEVVAGWQYKPVVQTSQVGYLPNQPKTAIIEMDRKSEMLSEATLIRYDADGEKVVKRMPVEEWQGSFLRYNYAKADFSDVKTPGLYTVKYGESTSTLFRIDNDVYDRGVWQPVIEYFLPVQMCHMRVSEKYRVWHDLCHMDDARMAMEGSHIDGYAQMHDNLTSYDELDMVHGLNVGGWHDAGDFDLRVESQSDECYVLTMAYEMFHPNIDVTAIDQNSHTVEIHQPDGKNDILQQIEHGALTVVNGYLALGRLYRGIICNTIRQYVLLGDASAMTDGIPGNDDDRWVFTENNPSREMSTAAALAASSRALKGYNDTLSAHCLGIARQIFESQTSANTSGMARFGFGNMGKVQTAAELYIATGEQQYLDYILTNWNTCVRSISNCGWYLARIEKIMETQDQYSEQVTAFKEALKKYSESLDKQSLQTPYGVPYRPSIWGAGWDIESFGYRHYFLVKEYPEIFSDNQVFNALNFILGCHPGINQRSFAGGSGTQSTIVGYGLNRADWSYIPGGVVSGTALIQPDFPELLEFPYLWQQVEYCLGGDSTHYMFLVLAAMSLLGI
ncbi:MAG: glycoside hydrolase family 9 protein [Bacteroidaceae bacterium]|nr:glycoside hydrolase family 9 protein [Bacteroidaceae bacterium]